jgi:hypothetical protein
MIPSSSSLSSKKEELKMGVIGLFEDAFEVGEGGSGVRF